jgi:hypothetical protein
MPGITKVNQCTLSNPVSQMPINMNIAEFIRKIRIGAPALVKSRIPSLSFVTSHLRKKPIFINDFSGCLT